MALSPEVKQVVEALAASARGQMASSAGLEKVDTRLKEVEGRLSDLVEELKIANVIERTGHEQRAQSERARWDFVRELLDRTGRFFNSRPMWAVYAFVGLLVANAFGISPQTVSVFFAKLFTPGPP